MQTHAHQDVEWYEGEVMQTTEGSWSTQPLDGLCLLCGEGVESLALTEDLSKEEVVEKCGKDHGFFAKLLLLHEIQEGKIPRGFECSIVRSIHTVGQMADIHRRAVNKRHFFGNV